MGRRLLRRLLRLLLLRRRQLVVARGRRRPARGFRTGALAALLGRIVSHWGLLLPRAGLPRRRRAPKRLPLLLVRIRGLRRRVDIREARPVGRPVQWRRAVWLLLGRMTRSTAPLRARGARGLIRLRMHIRRDRRADRLRAVTLTSPQELQSSLDVWVARVKISGPRVGIESIADLVVARFVLYH